MATFLQLQQRIALRLKDPNHTAVALDTIKDAINEAVRTWKHTRFWFNESTATNTLTVNEPNITSLLPNDFLIEIPRDGFAVQDSVIRYPLEKVSPQEYDNLNIQAQGRPYRYTWVGSTYLIYFYPDQAYTLLIKYLKEYSDMTSDVQTNDFTVYADQLIMYEALYKLMAEIRQDEKMSAYYEDEVKKEYGVLTSRTQKNIGNGSLSIQTFL